MNNVSLNNLINYKILNLSSIQHYKYGSQSPKTFTKTPKTNTL